MDAMGDLAGRSLALELASARLRPNLPTDGSAPVDSRKYIYSPWSRQDGGVQVHPSTF